MRAAQGHAYTMLRLELLEGIRLVQLRNPWGSFEWDGAWSDKSSEWNKHPRVRVRSTYLGALGWALRRPARCPRVHNARGACRMHGCQRVWGVLCACAARAGACSTRGGVICT